MKYHDAGASIETWRAREAQLLMENEAVAAQVQQITADMHELKAECLSKELEHKSATTELNMRHQLYLAREKLTVMEDEIRQMSDSNARLAGRCNSVQVEASRASQKLHINQQELSAKLRMLEDRVAGTHDQFRTQLDAQLAEADEFEKSFCNSIAEMETKMDAIQVSRLP
jgi:hypothetical protein